MIVPLETPYTEKIWNIPMNPNYQRVSFSIFFGGIKRFCYIPAYGRFPLASMIRHMTSYQLNHKPTAPGTSWLWASFWHFTLEPMESGKFSNNLIIQVETIRVNLAEQVHVLFKDSISYFLCTGKDPENRPLQEDGGNLPTNHLVRSLEGWQS